LDKVSVCFVCMGNICRSPTAEGVFRKLVEANGLSERVNIDSAGTHGYHIGGSPDSRAAASALKRGYDLSCLKARKVEARDFRVFDYLLAMDLENLGYLKALRPSEAKAEARLFMEFSRRFSEREVPDPYYGGTQGFERVLDMVEDASEGFLQHLLKNKLEL
jgi:protein-tyrosine phosphatase